MQTEIGLVYSYFTYLKKHGVVADPQKIFASEVTAEETLQLVIKPKHIYDAHVFFMLQTVFPAPQKFNFDVRLNNQKEVGNKIQRFALEMKNYFDYVSDILKYYEESKQALSKIRKKK